MAKIIGNTTATPNPRPDWLQDDPKKADYIKNKPDVIVHSDIDNELNLESNNPIQNSTVAQRFNELDESLKEYANKQDTDTKFSAIDQSINTLETEVETIQGDLTSHANTSNAQFETIRNEFATADTNTLVTALEYSDAKKNEAVSEAKAYTDSEIEKLVTDTEFEGVLSTIQEIQNAMATDEELAQALETAAGTKVDKGAVGSSTQPIYFDENGAQPIAYKIEKDLPADAKLTDTLYTIQKDSTQKKIQLLADGEMIAEVDDNNTTYELASANNHGLMSKDDKIKLDNLDNITDTLDILEIKEASGKVIAVDDSANSHPAELVLYGYTEQNGTPTPEAPVPLVSVGDSGSFEVGVYGGKNLMPMIQNSAVNIFTPLADGIKISGTTTGSFAQNIGQVTQKFTLGKGKYKLVCFANGSLGGASIYLCLRVGASTNYTQALANGGVVEFEVTETTSFLPFIYIAQSGVTVDCTVYGMVTTIDADATTYEPFKSKQTLTMPYTLAGAKNNVRSEIDFTKGKVTEVAHKEVFDGSDDEKWETLSNGRVSITVDSVYAPNGNDLYNPGNILCSVANICSWATLENATSGCAVGSTASRKIGFKIVGHTESVDAWKSYLASNPITVVYELKTPIETPLTETELNAYRQLMMNKPNTTLISDANMELKYVVDSNTAEYVERRFGEVEKSKSLEGLESTIEELNYLKGAKGNIQDQIDQLDAGGSSVIIDSELSATSTNPVQNKVVNAAINAKANASDLTSHTGNKNNPHGVSLSQLGVTATAAELNALDGITATTTELNYVDGVTSNIQTQLNNKASAGFHKKWSCVTTVGSYSKLCRISGYSNFIMRIGISQNDQVSYFTLLIGTGHNVATISCLGGSGYANNTNQIVRLTKQSATVFDVELYNTYGYNSATSVNVTCNILSPHSDINVTTYTAYTATSGTSVASCTCRPSGIVAPTFYGALSGNADTATKLTSSNGSATQPIYFSDGKPVNCTHTLGASVPSDAKFTDTVYTHPTTPGNKHIPSGGSSGQILRWSADGTAAWGADNNTTYSAATTSANGLMTAAMVTKLNGIATGANAYSHPTTSGNKHIPSGGSAGQILRWSADGTAAWGADNNTTYTLGSFGITATAAQLNYCSGVTSNIQTQLNSISSLADTADMNATDALSSVQDLTTPYTGSLNNLKAPGLHYVANSDGAGYPVGTNGYVLVIANADNTRVRQVFFRSGTLDSNDHHWYSRQFSSSWGKWTLLSGTESRYSGTYTNGDSALNVGSIYGAASGWVVVAQVGANKRLATLFIPRSFLNTDTTKWCFSMSGDDYYLTFYFYYSGETLYLKINTSSNFSTNAIKYVYAMS